MSQWVTDTHALLWHLYDANKLSPQARNIFTGTDAGEHQIVIPAIVVVEIIYLSEKGRIARDAVEQVIQLLQADSDNYLIAPLDLGIATALQHIGRDAVSDMPDRVIAATALHLELPLLTRDTRIIKVGAISTVW